VEENLSGRSQALQKALAAANAEVQKLRNDRSADQARVGIEAFEAQTDRIKAMAEVKKAGAAKPGTVGHG
jgi:hypothetical protein